ncbi:excinuclease ABC subunit UvrA [Patescibacteria group bacterium]|nr:excinuclease ABC subunit UvrA [Patescibacteria group bacterium]
MDENIIIKGARMHNLKNINLTIPHNKLVVITGVSGSGKSSLAFDTIFAEGQRRYIESLSPYARQFLGQMKPAEVDEIIGLAPSISIDQKSLSHNPRSTVGTLTEIYDYLRVLFARLGEVYCPICKTKIEKLSVDEMIDIISKKAKDRGDKYITILAPVVRGRKGEYYQLLYDYLSLGYSQARVDGKLHNLHDKINLARYKKHDIDIVVDKIMLSDRTRLYEAVESALDYGQGVITILFDSQKKKSEEMLLSANWTCPKDNFSFPEIEPRLFSFNSPHGACPTCHGLGMVSWEDEDTCGDCHGLRLRPETLSIRINKVNIAEISAWSIDKAHKFFEDYFTNMPDNHRVIAEPVVVEIISRLEFLLKVGLNYLTLDRRAHTLSGGEAQRIRLSSQIGSHLSRTLYVLDEPTIGLHERDTSRLIETLRSLQSKNNSVIIVEHDEQTIMSSDYLVDLGPMAGIHGGEVMIAGETNKIINVANSKKSLTVDYLVGKRRIHIPDKRREKSTESLKLIGARANNLKNLQVEIPLRKLVGISGVSGSGKSSLLYDVLYKNLSAIKNRPGKFKLQDVTRIEGSEYISKVIVIDQSPIGRTPRSNPATYTGIFTPIRDFFALLPEARERGYSLSRFSFNRPGGRCEACDGAGAKLIEMHFLPAVYVECDVCRGKRFNRETLQVKYKGKNIAEVLALTIDEAIDYFDANYRIADKLKVLQEVGLGYLQLGQSATTLSGGEAQRIKLARELTHTLGKRSLYLLDEPTVGLHYHDVEMLLQVLNKLVVRQNTVVVIEHNLHMLKSMDYLLDLGPEGGDEGGKLVASGTPEEVANNQKSVTGYYLKEQIKNDKVKRKN